ncbi:MAG: phage portal protein, partial [Deltaproteobacteria bacterium]|nr:phage portal protein [Deltaproteobacteria bacterium]
MNILNKFKELIRGEKARHIVINYAAGKYDNTLDSVIATYDNADEDIQKYVKVVRGRSRTLAKDNPFYRKYLESLVKYVVGSEGFKLQVQGRNADGSFDTAANDLIEREFEQVWAYMCDDLGEMNFYDMCCIIIKSVARDGEVFIVVNRNATNKYRYTLRLYEADAVPVDYNRKLSNGNEIVMGIEKDKNGRRVNYYFETKSKNKYIVIPADRVIHLYRPERIGQTRGIPWTHASIVYAAHLYKYIEAAVINARVGAAKMGYIEREDMSGDIIGLGNE